MKIGPVAYHVAKNFTIDAKGTRPARRPGGTSRPKEHRRRGASMGRRQRGEVAGLGGGDELSWTECAITLTDRLDERACGPLIHVATHSNSLGDLDMALMSAMEPLPICAHATDTSMPRPNAREPNTQIGCRNVWKLFGRNAEALLRGPAGCANSEEVAAAGLVSAVRAVTLDVHEAKSSSSWACRDRASRRWSAA